MRKIVLLFSLIAFFGLGVQAQIQKEAIDIGTVAGTVSVTETNPSTGLPYASERIGTETGTVTYTSSVTVTLSGTYSAITSDAQLVYIKYVPASGDAEYLTNGSGGVTLRHSGGVITVSGAGTPFAVGDVYEVGSNAPQLTTDYNLEALQMVLLNGVQYHYTSASDLTSENDTLTTSWQDIGVPVDMRSYNKGAYWASVDINASSNVQWRVLFKQTSGATNEYNKLISTIASTVVTIEPEYIEQGTDSDQLYVIKFLTDNLIPFVQLQAKIGTDGGADAIIESGLGITKSY